MHSNGDRSSSIESRAMRKCALEHRTRIRLPLAVALGGLLWTHAAWGQKRAIDAAHSVMKIHVYKAGLFSALGHEHEIAAPIAQGDVENSGNPTVELRIEASKLQVLDPDLSTEKRAEVQSTMEGQQVLDSSHFPEIRFHSTQVEERGAGHWTVRGELTLHGRTRAIEMNVIEQDGRYRGSAILKQRDFGITPVSVAGGAVKVKDAVKVEFDVALAQ